jgi:radical SAM superfamily enzyme YgiQ (UPF0313 family)
MAKILFISINDVNSEGVRTLSAVLKQNGHQAYIIFVQKSAFPYNKSKKSASVSREIENYDWVGIDEYGRRFRYSRGPDITPKEESLLLLLIKKINPDLIGFSVTTPLKNKYAYVTKLIKERLKKVTIWGGSHATIDPEDSLNYCDVVCVGEAEKTILDIARRIDNKEDVRGANNLVYSKNDQIVRNPLNPLIADLNELPFKDIYPDDKFLIDNDSIVEKFNEVSYSQNLRYHMISSRGCPFKCSYCCENFFHRLYSPQKFLRRRSPQNVINELKEAKKNIDYSIVQFEDEIFSIEYSWLEEFTGMYKKEINLPFVCYIYMAENIEKQLKMLREAGLTGTCLALQSGSEKINRCVFNRAYSRELYIKTAFMLKSLGIGYYVDIITYNPFENINDLQDTLDVLNQLPKGYGFSVNKLYILKGTQMYELAKGLETKKDKNVMPDRVFNYYSRLFWLTTQYNKHVIALIQKIPIFKRFPFLISISFTWLLRVMRIARRLIMLIKNLKWFFKILVNPVKNKDFIKRQLR